MITLNTSCEEGQCHLATLSRSVHLWQELAISDILVFALVFILEARLLWSVLDWHNSFDMGFILQGVLIRRAGFPLYTALQVGHIVLGLC